MQPSIVSVFLAFVRIHSRVWRRLIRGNRPCRTAASQYEVKRRAGDLASVILFRDDVTQFWLLTIRTHTSTKLCHVATSINVITQVVPYVFHFMLKIPIHLFSRCTAVWGRYSQSNAIVVPPKEGLISRQSRLTQNKENAALSTTGRLYPQKGKCLFINLKLFFLPLKKDKETGTKSSGELLEIFPAPYVLTARAVVDFPRQCKSPD